MAKKTQTNQVTAMQVAPVTQVKPKKASKVAAVVDKTNWVKLAKRLNSLDGVRQKVFLDRYSLKDIDGKPTEFYPEEMWERVANGIAGEEKTSELKKYWAEKFYWAMEDFKFVPAGRILSGAGTGYEVTFFNCYVIPSPADSRGGIMENITHTVEIQARAGGVGVNLSSLRPSGTRVRKVNGTSSGPVNWASLYSTANHDVIQQGGCFAADTLIMTHRGLTSVEEIVKSKSDWFVSTHQGYKKVTTKFDNGVKKLYEVKTESGYKVQVTGEHKLMTVDQEGHFYLKRLADFKTGEPTVMLLGDWLEDLPFVPLNTSLPIPSKYSSHRKKLDLPKNLNEELAFLIGVYDADGSKVKDEFSANGKGLRIAVSHDRPKDLKKLINTIKSIFGVKPVVLQGDGAVWNVCVYGREINEFMKLNGLLKDLSINVEVPRLIYNSPKTVVEAYLAGVFSGDGSNRGGKGGFRICTVSEKYASQLQLLLTNLGIACKIKIQDRSKDGWRTLYTITINGNRFMKKFHQMILPYTDKASDKAFSKRDGSFNWPFNLVDRFTYLSGFQRTMARTNPTTSFKSVQFLEHSIPKLTDSDRDDISLLASCVADKITAIQELDAQNVYDLEVEDVHLLSGNGFYTSNSRRGALMLMLNDWHPDVIKFIHVKEDLTKIPGANLSVCLSDKFMEAVKVDGDWTTKFPDINDPDYDEVWDGDIEGWEAAGRKVIEHETYKAREIWDQICEAAWRSAEPGLHFLERSNKWGNTWYFEKLLSTNPCVTGDTLVATVNGWQRVDQIKKGETIGTVLGSGKVDTVEVHENTPVYKVKFSDGAELRVTAAHQFHAIKCKDRAKNSANKKFSQISLKDLEIGDVVRIAPAPMPDRAVKDLPQGWKEKDYGFFVGMLLGDGCIAPKTINRNIVKIAIDTREEEWAEIVRNTLQKAGGRLVRTNLSQGFGANIMTQDIGGAAMLVRNSLITPSYSWEKEIPIEYQQTNRDFLAGLIDGLFSTDGNVNLTTNHPQLRFKTTSKRLAFDLRRILFYFGIHGRVATIKKVADSSIEGRAIIAKHQQYELIISGAGIKRFAEQIGLSHPDKQKRLLDAQLNFALTGNTWLAHITSIELDGVEKVYDLYEPVSDTWITEGIVSRGCGEQPLGPWAVCNLGSLNLAVFVKEDGTFDYPLLEETTRIAMRFMDNVVDANFYFYEQNEKASKDIRRTGIGTMGLGDAMIKMKVRYGTDESLQIMEKIYKTIRDVAYETSSDLAKEKGPFPKFDAEKYLQGHFIQRLPENIREKIKTQGIRNAVILTQAPTGTTSLLAGVSSGIEPVYDFAFVRRDRTGESTIYHPLFKEWKDSVPEGTPVPDYFVAANDLTPEDHIQVQAMAQRYTDSSISKTVNAPNAHTVDDVKKLYTMAYDLGLKGVTYFRDGSRTGVLSHIEEKKEEHNETPSQDTVVSRPMILRGRTYKLQTPVGEGFITINRDDQDQPFEVFVTVGRGGTHTLADAEAIGRLVSLALKLGRSTKGITPVEIAHKIASQLRGIGGASHVGFGKDRVMSLADAIAKALSEDLALSEQEKQAEAIPLNLTQDESKKDDVISQPLFAEIKKEVGVQADLCPECGDASLIREEGCYKCYSCGYSKC